MQRPAFPSAGCLVLLAALTTFAETKSLGHVTDPLNVPLFGRAGQARLSMELGQKSEGMHAQGGVAVGSRLALVAAGSYAQLNNCTSCTISERRHAELGLATFQREPKGWVREALAGVGTGRFKASGPYSDWDPQSEELRVTGGIYKMVFLQGNIGQQFRFTDRAASLRLSAWQFDRFSRQDGNGQSLPVAASHQSVYLEPGLVYRLGYKDLKAETQLGFCLPLIEASELDNSRIWFSLGIGLDLFNG
jgi:hypothetical protein